jgi:hypothetical protein
MRGIIFRGFLKFMEDTVGDDKSEQIIEEAALENDGAYTSGIDYPFSELLQMVVLLSKAAFDGDVQKTLYEFGRHIFDSVIVLYDKIAQNGSGPISTKELDVLTFLASLTDIHLSHVKKLYPTAVFPAFDIIEQNTDTLVLEYKSDKELESFAKGLMERAGDFFNEPIAVELQTIERDGRRIVRFEITRKRG